MEPSTEQTLQYSNRLPSSHILTKKIALGIFAVLTALSMAAALVTLYMGGDLLILTWVSVVFAIAFGFITWIPYSELKRNANVAIETEVNERGIEEEWEYKDGRKEENVIPYEDIKKVILAHNAYYIHDFMHMGRGHYYIRSIIVVFYRDSYFLKRINNEEEWGEWFSRLKNHDIPVFYAPKDLHDMHRAHFEGYKIDFSKLEATPWWELKEEPRILSGGKKNPFDMWMEQDTLKRMNKDKKERTKNVDQRVTFGILIYGLLMGLLLFPGVPVEDGGYALEGHRYFLYILLPGLAPLFFASWRKYYKWWLMPVVYYITYALSTTVGVGVSSLFTGQTLHIGSIFSYSLPVLFFAIFDYLFVLFGRAASFISQKLRL